MKYKISEYAKLNHVTYRTVWNWIKEGKLETERSTTGRIQIVVDEAKEKTVAIIGYNKEAEEEANFLNEIASKTYFIPMYKGEGLMRGNNLDDTIEVINERPIEIKGETLVNQVSFKTKNIDVDGVFVIKDSASPKTLVPGLDVDGSHVKVDINMNTNISGCFACGDIAGKPYSYIKSAGQGQIAAINAVSYLDQLKIKERNENK